MEFSVGEKVIYPNHGIGVVESIQTRGTPSGTISLYQLRILANQSRVWIPHQNADGVGLRPVVTSGDVRKIFTLLGDGTIDHHSNWKGRFKENSDKMRTGCLYDVVVVLKGLAFLSRKKSLSFREKRMLDRAKFLLVSELAEVEGKTQASIEERVDRALEKTFCADPEYKAAELKAAEARAAEPKPLPVQIAPAIGKPGTPVKAVALPLTGRAGGKPVQKPVAPRRTFDA